MPVMPRQAVISQEKLVALGADKLAELVLAQCEQDASFKKQVRLLLADGSGGAAGLIKEIDRRLATLQRAKRPVEWRETAALVQEIDTLRQTIAERLAAADPAAAIDRLRRLIALGGPTVERVEGSGVGEVFRAAVADLGRILAGQADRDPKGVAALLVESIEGDRYAFWAGAVPAFAEALGEAGRAELGRLLRARVEEIKPGPEDYRAAYARRILIRALEDLADLTGDVDAYIAAAKGEPVRDEKRLEIAERLIGAGRAEEALDWLEPYRGYDGERLIELRLAALEALGRKEEAQRLRWSWFERTLNARQLKEHVRRLPDFDGFEAERRAVQVALVHEDAHAALGFLLELPDLASADRLVRERLNRLDGQRYDVLAPAAERLAEKHPLAATLLWRRMVENILGRASSNQYGYAARDVQHAAALASRLPDEAGIESHAAWMDRLQREHGRKYAFWQRLEKRG